MLGIGVRMCTGGRFESHGADGAFVEDFTVGSLNVRLKSSNISEDDATVYTAVTNSARVVQAVLGHMRLEMYRSTNSSTLWADIWRLMLMNPLMGSKTTLVWQQHLANGAGFLSTRLNSLLIVHCK